MHYIDTPTSVAGQFVDPAPGQPPTVWDADHANAIQNELLNVIQHAGLAPEKGNHSQLLAALLALTGPAPSPGKNPLINPAFLVAQDGNGPFIFDSGGGPVKLFDGWWFSRGFPEGGISAQRQTFAPSFADIPGNPKYWLDWQSTQPGTGFFRLASRIESVRTFQGMVVTLSGWIWNQDGGPAPVTVTPRIVQKFGAGGSADVVTAATPITLNSSAWTFFATTVTLPTLAGKVIGAGGDDVLEYGLEIPATVSFALGVTRLQMEAGNVATVFDEASEAVALLRCMRYRERTQSGLPVALPLGLEDPVLDNLRGAITAWGRGIDTGGGTAWALPALQRAWIVPKRQGAILDSAQRFFAWYPALSNGVAGEIDLNNVKRTVTQTLGMSEFHTGFPVTATNPGGGVEIVAHYAFDDLII